MVRAESLYGERDRAARSLDALEDPRLEAGEKNTVNIVGTIPFSAVTRFCPIRYVGRAFQMVVRFLDGTEYPLKAVLTFNPLTNLPVCFTFSSGTAQALTPQYKLLSLEMTLNITDSTLTEIEIPEEVLAAEE